MLGMCERLRDYAFFEAVFLVADFLAGVLVAAFEAALGLVADFADFAAGFAVVAFAVAAFAAGAFESFAFGALVAATFEAAAFTSLAGRAARSDFAAAFLGAAAFAVVVGFLAAGFFAVVAFLAVAIRNTPFQSAAAVRRKFQSVASSLWTRRSSKLAQQGQCNCV